MTEPIRIARGVLVPAAALEWRAVRSSGPGGQNVNKVASKVELHVELAGVTGLDPAARARLAAITANKRDAEGRLVVTSQKTRDQVRNLEDARSKVLRLVERALRAPRPRRITAPSRGAVERRLRTKRVRSTVKRARGTAGTRSSAGSGPRPVEATGCERSPADSLRRSERGVWGGGRSTSHGGNGLRAQPDSLRRASGGSGGCGHPRTGKARSLAAPGSSKKRFRS